jgi:hypothetical protein
LSRFLVSLAAKERKKERERERMKERKKERKKAKAKKVFGQISAKKEGRSEKSLIEQPLRK